MGKYHFVIITPGRSGSEHLAETLSHYPDIEMDGEVFNRSNKAPGSFNHFLRSGFFYKWTSFFFNRGKISTFRWNLPLRLLILRFLNKRENSSDLLKGFKLPLDQLNAYPFVLEYIRKERIRIIYLNRKDRLSMTLSLIRARNSRQYHSKTEMKDDRRYFFDPREVKEHYQELEKWEEELLRQLPRGSYFKLSYESLWQNYEQLLKKMRAYLELKDSFNPRFSSIKKNEPRSLENWVENLDEIKAVLSKNDTKA